MFFDDVDGRKKFLRFQINYQKIQGFPENYNVNKKQKREVGRITIFI